MARIDARWRSQYPSRATRSKRFISHVKARHPEICKWVVVPDGANNINYALGDRSSMRVQNASSMSAVNEICDTSSWKVELLWRALHGSKTETPSKSASPLSHTRYREASVTAITVNDKELFIKYKCVCIMYSQVINTLSILYPLHLFYTTAKCCLNHQ